MVITFCTYLKPDDHEWKNKKGLINFLLFDFKWERTQKDVEKLKKMRGISWGQEPYQHSLVTNVVLAEVKYWRF